MTVTVKDKLELTIPPSLQRQAGFRMGDEIEFRAFRGIIMVVPRSAQETPLMKAFRATHREAKRQGLDKMTMKQINAEIATYRKEKREQPTKPRGK